MEPLSSDGVKSAYDGRKRSLRAQLRMRQPELWLLGIVLLIAVLLLTFVSIAEEVFEGDTAASTAMPSLLSHRRQHRRPHRTALGRGSGSRHYGTRQHHRRGHPVRRRYWLSALAPETRAALLMLITVAGGTALNDVLKFFLTDPARTWSCTRRRSSPRASRAATRPCRRSSISPWVLCSPGTLHPSPSRSTSWRWRSSSSS